MVDINIIRKVKKRHEHTWMTMEGVVAVGIGLTSEKEACIVISTASNSQPIRQAVPKVIEGVVIEVKETGPIIAF